MAIYLIPELVRGALHDAIDSVCDQAGELTFDSSIDIKQIDAGQTMRAANGKVTVTPNPMEFRALESGEVVIKWGPERNR